MGSSLVKPVALAIWVAVIGVATLHSQLLSEARKTELQENSNVPASLSPEVARKFSQNIVAGPKISFPVQAGPDPKQAASARRGRRLIELGNLSQPSSPATGMLLQQAAPTTLLASSSGGLGPEHTQAAGGLGGVSSPNTVQATRGRVGTGSNITKIGMAPRPLPCTQPVVSDVNGANGITTIIFLEPGKHYAIHGCGFGSTQGEAYLVGVKYQPIAGSGVQRGMPRVLHPNWIRLIPAAGADPHQSQIWTDTEIQMVVDPNASGFYDDYWDADVVVFPVGKPKIQSIDGFGFWAARAEQTLSSVPLPPPSPLKLKQPNSVSTAQSPWFIPASVSDNLGHFVAANLLSPSAGSLILPGHTFAVVRDDNSGSFAAKQDVVLLHPYLLQLTNGFQPSGVQLFTTGLSPTSCGSNFSSSGAWNTTPSGLYKVFVSWQEQSCGSNGVSAYALDLKVTGPRGVSPQLVPGN